MPELQEVIHLSYNELHQGPKIGWDQAAMRAADIAYPEATTEEGAA